MSIVEKQVTIINKYGLHARPAMQLVEMANTYNCKIAVSNGTLSVDAKSIMSVMRLAGTMGTVLTIVAEGTDAEDAVTSLVKLISDGFGETEDASQSTQE